MKEIIPPHITRQQIAHILHQVHDPEIPGISIVDLGMVLDIRQEDSQWLVELAPTYSGCPAIDVIPFLTKAMLAENGFPEMDVTMIVAPPWSTEWISEEGRDKLNAWGIAPPSRKNDDEGFGKPDHCPQCQSASLSLISAYGATPCKAVYRCDDCQETFDYFKCY